MEIQVSENVYKPAEDSFLIADQIQDKRVKRALDLGTGCGILALICAEEAEEVVATDLNPYAVDCTKKNAQRNGLEHKIDFLIGDLFSPLTEGEVFDLIIFNPPYLPAIDSSSSDDYMSLSWYGGKNGRLVIERFLHQFPNFLKREGELLLVQSSLSGIEATLEKLHANGFKVEIVATKHFQFEEIAVIQCQREM